MTLMFQRLARNFAKNGYFPTDAATLEIILAKLKATEEGRVRILDTACGEGIALAECQAHLGKDRTESYGIELDEKRAWHAKKLLDHSIKSDLMDCLIEPTGFGLLFLNPPYGDLAKDQANATRLMDGRQRLEKLFYQRSVPALQFGGVMILIIPRYCIDKEFATLIARHFTQITAFTAPEQRFQQVVIMGLRQRATKNSNKRDLLLNFAQSKTSSIGNYTYVIPSSQKQNIRFASVQLDAKQLAEIVQKNPCLWEQFNAYFHANMVEHKRPLMDLSNWHLALALAAGQVSGLVTSKTGQRLLIKGDTYKTKVEKRELIYGEQGEVTEKRTMLDKFVPVIRALDLTRNSANYGQLITIQ